MQLTQQTDYALRTLIFLGLQPQDKLSTIQEIAEAYDISRNHLMKVVSKLVGLGYIESVRGAGGGIRLVRAPTSINVGAVVKDMEPLDVLVECMRSGSRCVISPACTLRAMFARASRAFMLELNTYTLDDLLPSHKRNELVQLLKLSQ